MEKIASRPHVKKTCEQCGEHFLTRGKSPSRERYCSGLCRGRAEYRRYFHKAEPRELICEACGKGFTTRRKQQYSCSNKCNDKLQNLRRKKERRRIWERDNYQCRMCGTKKKRLNVHHVDGSGEDSKPNNGDENLLSLCTKCHKEIHTINYRFINGELFVLGKVFAFFNVDTVKVLKGG